MKQLDPTVQYTINELSTITGIEFTRFYDYKDLLQMQKYILPSKRVGYGIHFSDFENALNENKTYQFHIPEYEIYHEKKRPVIRHFLDAKEVCEFMKLVGDPLTIYTVKRRIREGILPTYSLERKYICPIVHLIRRYTLPIDNDLNKLISDIIQSPYEFRL
jgi:hypothetical protein